MEYVGKECWMYGNYINIFLISNDVASSAYKYIMSRKSENVRWNIGKMNAEHARTMECKQLQLSVHMW